MSTAQPYGFSGVVSQSDCNSTDDVTASVYSATVQSNSRSLDGAQVFEAALTGRGRPYILLAVVKERSDMRVAEYLREKLPLELSKTFKHKPTRLTTSAQAHSPLYNTLLKICSGYKAISAYSESIFAYTETTAVLLDVKAQSLTRVHFGKQAVAALVLDSQGQPCQPTSSQQHYMDNTFVHEETFSSVAGRHSVVLGSPGLWQYIHPAKAGVHAYTYGSAPHLSTHKNRHDAASAIVHAALRTIVHRLASSPSPRTAVLHSLPQLDRLRPGSRDDSRKFALIPRARGDIHADLTAAVLQFTLHNTTPSRSSLPRVHSCSILNSALSSHPLSNAAVDFSCSLGKLFRSRSRPDLHASSGQQRQCSDGGLKGIFSRISQASTCSLSNTTHTSYPTSPLASPASTQGDNTAKMDSPATSQPASEAFKLCRFLPHDSVPEGASGDTIGASTDVMRTISSEANSAQGGSGHRGTVEGTRRWQLLQTHVNTMAQENTLRRQLWGSAVSLALSQHTVEGNSKNLGANAKAASPQCSEQSDCRSSSNSNSSSPARTPKCGIKGQSLCCEDAPVESIVSSWNFDTANSSRAVHGVQDCGTAGSVDKVLNAMEGDRRKWQGLN